MLLPFIMFTAFVLIVFSGDIIVHGISWLIATVRHFAFWWKYDQ
jgi:hypothetical protein